MDEHDALRGVDGREEGEVDEVGRRVAQPSGQHTTYVTNTPRVQAFWKKRLHPMGGSKSPRGTGNS